MAYTNPSFVGSSISGLERRCDYVQPIVFKNVGRLHEVEADVANLWVEFNALKKDFKHFINEHYVPQQNPFTCPAPCVCYLHSERGSEDVSGRILRFGLTRGCNRLFLVPISESPSEIGSPRSPTTNSSLSTPGLEDVTSDTDGQNLPITPSISADLQAFIEEQEDTDGGSEGSSGAGDQVRGGDGEERVDEGGD